MAEVCHWPPSEVLALTATQLEAWTRKFNAFHAAAKDRKES